MKKLKRLIETGSDKELLEYVRNDFSKKLDDYLTPSSDLAEMKNRYIALADSSMQREQTLTEMIKKLDIALSKFNDIKIPATTPFFNT